MPRRGFAVTPVAVVRLPEQLASGASNQLFTEMGLRASCTDPGTIWILEIVDESSYSSIEHPTD